MYAALALGWLLCAVWKRFRTRAFTALCLAAMASSGLALLATLALGGEGGKFVRLFFMFFTGASYFVLQHRIALRTPAALAVCGLLLIAALFSETAFLAAYLVGISYLTFYVAYVPRGFIRRFNRFGDFSYGMYVYAFPVQQALIALTPGISPLPLMAWSGLVTLGLAVPSWFLIEKPALQWKGRLVDLIMDARRRMGWGATSAL